MNCSVALQFLPMDAASDDEVCRIVDEVIAEIDASGLSYYVGPFETAVEGDLDECMDLVKRCIKAGEKAGCAESASYLKISYRSDRGCDDHRTQDRPSIIRATPGFRRSLSIF